MSPEITTQVPIQTRPDTLNKLERMFPLLVAESRNRCVEYYTGRPQKRVDIWNTVGRKIDLANHGVADERYIYNSHQIDERYRVLMSIYGITAANRVVLRDDDTDYQQIVHDEISALINDDVVKVEAEDFTRCIDCGQVIAPTEVHVTNCVTCGGRSFDMTRKSGLFLFISKEDRDRIKKSIIISPASESQRFRSMVDNMPARIQLSKDRDYGLSLGDFGVDSEFVFDPKIALAMAGSVLRNTGVGDLEVFIHGPLAVSNIIPYFLLLDKTSRTRFISIGLVPSFNGKEVEDSLTGFYFPYLSLLMMTGINLSAQQKEAFRNEHFKTVRRFQRSREQAIKLSTQFSGNTNIAPLETGFLNEALQLILQLKSREAILTVRNFVYSELSEKYFDNCRKNGLLPDMEAIERVSAMFELLYG